MEKAKPKKTPREYAEAIKQQCKSVPEIIDTGSLCAEAQNVLNDDERDELMTELKGSMSKGNFSKLVKIGTEKKRLREIQDKLPPNYTTIYLLAKLPPKDLAKAIAVGQVNPNVTRDEAVLLAGGNSRSPSDLLGKLFALEGCSDQTRVAVTKAIEALAEKYDGQVQAKLPAVVKTEQEKQAA